MSEDKSTDYLWSFFFFQDVEIASNRLRHVVLWQVDNQ